MEGYDVLHVVGFISLKQSCHWSILNLNNSHTNAMFSTFPAQNAISIVKTGFHIVLSDGDGSQS